MDVHSLVTWIGIVLSVVGIIVYSYYSFKFSYWKKRGVRYVKPVVFLGNLSFIMSKSAWQFFAELYQTCKIEEYIGIYLASQPALVVQTPELAKKILVKDAEYFQDRYLYAGYSDPLGALNLFTVKNPIWSKMRHELSPMFTSSRLRMVTELMNINAQQLVNKIQRDYVDTNGKVCLKELFSMYTSDTVAYSVFGLRVSALSGKISPLWQLTNKMVNWTFRRGLEFITIFFLPAVAAIFRLKFFSAEATDYVKKLFWSVVKERENSGTSYYDKDLVSHLLKMKENLKLPTDDPELMDNLVLAQAAVFVLGSVETSSSALSYCLHELAYHPEEQEKLYKEVNDAKKQKGKDILEYEDLIELKYLSACLYETLRKYPPVPYLDRVCNKRYTLNDKVTVEKGVPVFLNVLALHYNEAYYPDPHEWRPERAYDLSDNDNHDFTYLPFGDGPRFCIGKRYGMMQMRAALAEVIHKYAVQPGAPYDVPSDPYSLILGPENGGCVKFISR